MKLARTMLALLLVIAALAPVTRPAHAASEDATDAYTSSDAAGAPNVPAADPTGSPNSKGGVLAAAGCGFAIASLVLAPNPVSAFMTGFNCGFFFLDAVGTPDR